MPETEYLEDLWREAWTPPDRKEVWKWAEEHIENIPYSPIPGRFRVANSPMLAEVMQEMVNPRTRVVSIIAAVQSSKSTAIEIARATSSRICLAPHSGWIRTMTMPETKPKGDSVSCSIVASL